MYQAVTWVTSFNLHDTFSYYYYPRFIEWHIKVTQLLPPYSQHLKPLSAFTFPMTSSLIVLIAILLPTLWARPLAKKDFLVSLNLLLSPTHLSALQSGF